MAADLLERFLFGNRITTFIPAPRYYPYAVSLAQSTMLDLTAWIQNRQGVALAQQNTAYPRRWRRAK